jgi:hypothetical protein
MGRPIIGTKNRLLDGVWLVMKSRTCGDNEKTLNLGGNSRRNSR